MRIVFAVALATLTIGAAHGRSVHETAGQDDWIAECADHSSYRFDLRAHGALATAEVLAGRQGRADLGLFADGLSVVLSAGYCSHPAYTLNATAPLDHNLDEALATLLAVMDDQACQLGETQRAAFDPVPAAVMREGGFAHEGAYFVSDAVSGWTLAVAAHEGEALFELSCEIFNVGG